MTSFSRSRVVAFIATAAIVGTGGVVAIGGGGRDPSPPVATATPTATPDPTLANIWIDPTTAGATCTDHASQVTYVNNESCSWDAANDTCEAGDTVGVMAGSYGNVNMTGTNSRAAACAITVVPGESVSMGQFMDCYGGSSGCPNFLTITGPISATGTLGADSTTGLVFDNIDWNFGHSVITQPFHKENGGAFTVKNSKIHNVTNANAMAYISGSGPFLFDNVDFYDSSDNTGGTIHTECMYATSVSNMTINRGHFWGCATEDIFITGDELATNWSITNTIFEHPLGPNENALAFRSGSPPSPSPDGFDLKYNTFGRGAGVQINTGDNSPTSNGFNVIGNFFYTQDPCGMPNSTYDYNAFIGSGCGTHSVTNTSTNFLNGFVGPHDATSDNEANNGVEGNYALVSGSPLIDHGQTVGFPTTDHEGLTRPVNSTADIGAYEFTP